MEGNQMKMREAFEEIIEKIDAWRTDGTMEHWQYSQLFDIADAALSESPRQCDVGTSAEQNNRYEHYCFTHRTMERCCQDCPIKDEPCCELAWAQMPYEAEEGGAK